MIIEKPIYIPHKEYYVLGTGWSCYVSPSTLDGEYLTSDDLFIELSTMGVEAFFGLRFNPSLTVLNKEQEPTIGVVLGVCEKGDEDDDNAYLYIPSYLALGNCGKYADSQVAYKAYCEFHEELEKKMIEEKAKAAKKKKKKNPPSEGNSQGN